jgi:hypothetical protein
MRKLLIGLGLGLAMLMAGVVLAQKIDRNYNHKAPWREYRTFEWIRQPDMDSPDLNEQVVSLINGQLQAKGWRMVPADADVGLVANGSSEAHHTIESFYQGFPSGWDWHYWSEPGAAPITEENYAVGTLVVDMFDGRTKQLIWRGFAESTVSKNPIKNEEKLDKAVEKLFDNFPPK